MIATAAWRSKEQKDIQRHRRGKIPIRSQSSHDLRRQCPEPIPVHGALKGQGPGPIPARATPRGTVLDKEIERQRRDPSGGVGDRSVCGGDGSGLQPSKILSRFSLGRCPGLGWCRAFGAGCQFRHEGVEEVGGGGAGGGEAGFPLVHQGHQVIDFGDDPPLFGDPQSVGGDVPGCSPRRGARLTSAA